MYNGVDTYVPTVDVLFIFHLWKSTDVQKHRGHADTVGTARTVVRKEGVATSSGNWIVGDAASMYKHECACGSHQRSPQDVRPNTDGGRANVMAIRPRRRPYTYAFIPRIL
uniref:Uncharacterized protein n=1 Tax=Vespula pensylvanica TaxID=30213 RepID=A0A834UE63_VESPE|nr:hypothetical protein H0235_002614 [Vespula pensylvanica]